MSSQSKCLMCVRIPLRGALGKKVVHKTRNSCIMSGEGVGAEGILTKSQNWRKSWNLIRTFKECFCCVLLCFIKGGPEPLEKKIHEILGSKCEDWFSDPFFDWVRNDPVLKISRVNHVLTQLAPVTLLLVLCLVFFNKKSVTKRK